MSVQYRMVQKLLHTNKNAETEKKNVICTKNVLKIRSHCFNLEKNAVTKHET